MPACHSAQQQVRRFKMRGAGCDNKGTKCFESISWSGPGYAASTEMNPRAVFRRLFGQSAAVPRRASSTFASPTRTATTHGSAARTYKSSVKASKAPAPPIITFSVPQPHASVTRPHPLRRPAPPLRLMAYARPTRRNQTRPLRRQHRPAHGTRMILCLSSPLAIRRRLNSTTLERSDESSGLCSVATAHELRPTTLTERAATIQLLTTESRSPPQP